MAGEKKEDFVSKAHWESVQKNSGGKCGHHHPSGGSESIDLAGGPGAWGGGPIKV